MANEENGVWEEIMGKDLMIRRLTYGDGPTAEMGTVVTCDMRGYFVEKGVPTSKQFEEFLHQKFRIGESDAIPAIEMALRYSRKGDVMRVRCNSKFAFGPAGRQSFEKVSSNGDDSKIENKETVVAIPPNMDLEYELNVKHHLQDGEIDPDLLAKKNGNSDQSPERETERLIALTDLLQRKEAGNRWFLFGDFGRAIRAYSKATQSADRYFNGNANNSAANNERTQRALAIGKDADLTEAEKLQRTNEALAKAEEEKDSQRKTIEAADEELVSTFISCLNNMAACQLRLGENAKAKDVCVRVLELDPANQKALLRAAKASLALHEFEETDLCLKRLAQFATAGTPAFAALQQEKSKLKQAQAEYKAQRKKMSQNIVKQFNKSLDGEEGVASPEREGENMSKPEEAQAKVPSSSSASNTAGETVTAAAASATTTAPVVEKQPDSGLLLLLITSLLVLVVSVLMVVMYGKVSN